jgi:hypothetical protein
MPADWSPIITGLTVLLSTLSAVLAWVAKLLWGKEFAAAKDATIKSLQDGREDLKQSMASQLAAKDAEIEVWKEKYAFLERKLDENLWKQIDNQIDRQKKQIEEQTATVADLQTINTELEKFRDEGAGPNEKKALHGMINRLSKQLAETQARYSAFLTDNQMALKSVEDALPVNQRQTIGLLYAKAVAERQNQTPRIEESPLQQLANAITENSLFRSGDQPARGFSKATPMAEEEEAKIRASQFQQYLEIQEKKKKPPEG